MKITRTLALSLGLCLTMDATVASGPAKADAVVASAPTAAPAGNLVSWGESISGVPGVIPPSGNLQIIQQRLSGVVALAAYGRTGYALLRDGTVRSWGDNRLGQLGDGTTRNSTRPVQVRGLTRVRAITAGSQDGYALRADGTVWGWGSGLVNRLGAGNKTHLTPVRIRGLHHIVALAAARDTAYAVRADGTVWAWGSNLAGQLGNESVRSASSRPVRVEGLSGAVSVAGSDEDGYALLRDGTVRAWGDNSSGQLGSGRASKQGTRVPVLAHRLRRVIGITADARTAYALEADGEVRAWGSNAEGALGDQSDRKLQASPAKVHLLSGVASITSGGGSVYALKKDHTVWGWGRSLEGQLIIAGFPAFAVAVQLPGLSHVLAVAAGRNTDYAILGP